MKIHFDQQDIYDACIVFVAFRHDYDVEALANSAPGYVEAEHTYHQNGRHTAEVEIGGREFEFHQQDIIDAIIFYLQEYHHHIPETLGVELLHDHALDENSAVIYVARPGE